MLNMDYLDKNGNKWSIDQGDWQSPLSKNDNNSRSMFSGKRFILFLLTLALIALISFL